MRKEKLELLHKYVNELKWIKNEMLNIPNSFVTVEPHRFLINNKYIVREKISKNGKDGSAVIVIPMEKDTREFVVSIEPRVFTSKKVAVSFPAGYIESNETPREAALRELREETGYAPTVLKHLDAYYQDEGVSAAYNHMFLALNCEKLYEQELDPDEMIHYMTFTYGELLELEKMGYISGGNTKLALCRIKKNMKRG